MKTTEADKFKELFDRTNEYYDGKMRGLEVWWLSLRAYPLDMVRKAFSAHVQDPATGKFAPKAADIIGRIQSMDGHIGAEEAWAQVRWALGDESATLILTRPQHAAFLAADALASDKVAARMVFKEVYERELTNARMRGERISYIPVLGHSPDKRNQAIDDAVRDGKLLPDVAKRLSLMNTQPQLQNLEDMAPESVRQHIRNLRLKLERKLPETCGQ